MGERTCPVCHGPILRRSERARFCSGICKDAHWSTLRSTARQAAASQIQTPQAGRAVG